MNKQNLKLCIIGGGNLAHAFAGDLASKEIVKEVDILTRKPNLWNNEIEVYSKHKYHHTIKLGKISNDFKILSDADIMILTIPSNVRFDYLQKIKDYVSEKTIIMTCPSTGAINFVIEKMFPNNQYLCLQRTPYVCRTMKYGERVNSDEKIIGKSIYFSKNFSSSNKKLIYNLLGTNIIELPTFWTLILSNSNPIIHIARECEIISNDYPTSYPVEFYEKWGDKASELALKMDDDLAKIMEYIGVKEYKSLKQHYGVSDVKSMTQKMSSIEDLKGILSPMLKTEKGYILDTNSRYFTEDLPLGTCFIKYFAEKFSIKTPTIDYAINKIQQLMGKEYITNDKLNICNWIFDIHFNPEDYIRF